MLPPLLAHGMKVAEPTHVALAPCGHAVAEPIGLRRELPVELVPIEFLLLQHGVPPGLEMREAPIHPARQAAVEPYGGVRQAFEKTAVVADEDHRRTQALQLAFQPLDRRQIEVVGGLVEQKDVGLRCERLRQGGATALAAGQGRGLFLAGQTELLEKVAGTIRVVARSQTRLHVGERILEGAEIRLLGEVANGRARLDEARAAIRLDEAGGDLQQGGFAGAVPADKASPLARRDGQFGVLDEGCSAERQSDVLECQKWRCSHLRFRDTSGVRMQVRCWVSEGGRVRFFVVPFGSIGWTSA